MNVDPFSYQDFYDETWPIFAPSPYLSHPRSSAHSLWQSSEAGHEPASSPLHVPFLLPDVLPSDGHTASILIFFRSLLSGKTI